MFKPSTDSARLLVSTEKNFSVWGLEFSGGDVTSGAADAFFGQLYPALGANATSNVLAQVLFGN